MSEVPAQTYTVKPGDSLSKIAQVYGVNVNNITGYKSGNPNLIYPGETLTIGGTTQQAPAPAPATTTTQQPVAQTTQTQQITQQPQPAQQTTAQQLGLPQGSPQSIADLIAMGYGGYQGWNDEMSALADYRNTGGAGKWTGGTLGQMGGNAGIDLNSMYDNLYKSAGISDKEALLTQTEKDYLSARGKITDNPFLSSSMIDKRLQRLQQKYEETILPIKNEIAMKKADIEMRLNLAIKQFDINSQSAKDSLNYLNTLLGMGALSSASGADIANLTRMTGIPTSMIQSAIKYNSQNNVDTQLVTSTKDSGEVTVSAINTKTGELVKQTSLGMVGNAQTGSTKVTDAQAKELIRQDIMNEAQAGATWDAIYKLAVAGNIDLKDAYNIYLSMGIYHPTTQQQKEDLARYGIGTSTQTAY